MKTTGWTRFLVVLLSVVFFFCVEAETGAFMGGQGMMYGCPYGQEPAIPSSLQMPKNAKWTESLLVLLGLEIQSQRQYESDMAKYGFRGPYMRVLADEYRHIEGITRLLKAYGLKTEASVPAIIQTGTSEEALKAAFSLETALIPQYEWLILKAEDQIAANVLEHFLVETRHHAIMFQHMQWHGMRGPGWMMR